MGASVKLTRFGVAVALALGLLGLPTAPAAAAKDLTTPLPRHALLPAVVAVSGTHILVRADLSYRVSHNSGKTWAVANVLCPDTYPDTCLGRYAETRVGRVAGGVVTTYSQELDRLDAYSLVTDASVGSPYTLSFGESIVDRVGGLVLTQTWPTNAARVHSLLNGSNRDVTLPEDSTASLLPDGSLLIRNGGATTWYRQRVDGTSTPVLTSAPSTSEVVFSGFSMAYRASTKTICVLNLDTKAKTCRTLTSKHEYLAALSSTGALTRGLTASLYWYPISKGALKSPVRLPMSAKALRGYQVAASAENSPMVVAVSAPSTKLKLFKANRSISTTAVSWATRPVVPVSLALTANAVLGGTDSRYTSSPWVRTLTKSKIKPAKKLTGPGQVAASGSRWATSGSKLRIYDRGKLTVTTGAPESDQLTFSGPYLLARPLCRKAPLETDDDCYVSAVLRTAAGKFIATSAVTEDIFGELKVVRTGDRTVKSRTVRISNFVYPSAKATDVELPDLGADGYFTDVRLWGDTVAATAWPGGSAQPYPVVINYRTGQTFTGATGQQLKAFGDGVVVSVAPHGTNIRVWDFVHNTTRTISASAGPVSLDSSRLAYVYNGKLRVTNLTGVARSAPRILGLVKKKTGTRTWTMSVDVTKATKAGRVEIRTFAGTLVRTLRVDASSTGSMRNLTWNGRTAAGKKVPVGLYVARMVVNATDGTGAVTGLYGASTALAEFTIK